MSNAKINILFACYGLGIGGIEKCLINLLNSMDTNRYSIDLLPMNPIYDLADSIKADCNILDPFEYVMNTTDTYSALKERGGSLQDYLRYAAFRVDNKWGKKPWKLFKPLKKHYDVAVAYAHIPFVPYFVIDCVDADRKYMWHHEGRYIKGKRYKLDMKYYPMFNAIISVSEDNKNELLKAFPELRDKIKVLYNIIDAEEIRNKASEEIAESMPSEKIILTTVGRMSPPKNPEMMVSVASRLKEAGYEFCWYWVGGGELETKISTAIKENGLEDYVILLGNKENPYPYIQLCDIYVQPSNYEAFCTTTREAQILEKPIVVTSVGGMREQFEPGIDCIMTDINEIEIFDAIVNLIDDAEERERLRLNLHKKNFSTDSFLKQHYDLFNS